MKLWRSTALNVHCHVGSLEMQRSRQLAGFLVHCHVGSLETVYSNIVGLKVVHCHVGSLEI